MIRVDKETTKLRIIYDACTRAENKTAPSLSDSLYAGDIEKPFLTFQSSQGNGTIYASCELMTSQVCAQTSKFTDLQEFPVHSFLMQPFAIT